MAESGGGGRRNLLGVLNFVLQWEGLSESHKQFKTATESVKEYSNSVERAQSAVSAANEQIQQTAGFHHESFPAIKAAITGQQILAESLGVTWGGLMEGQIDYMELSQEQKAVFDSIVQAQLKGYAKLLKSQNEGVIGLEDTIDLNEQSLDQMLQWRERTEKIEEGWVSFTKILDRGKEVIDSIFGKNGVFLSGVEDTTGGIAVLQESWDMFYGLMKSIPVGFIAKQLGLDKEVKQAGGSIVEALFGFNPADLKGEFAGALGKDMVPDFSKIIKTPDISKDALPDLSKICGSKETTKSCEDMGGKLKDVGSKMKEAKNATSKLDDGMAKLGGKTKNVSTGMKTASKTTAGTTKAAGGLAKAFKGLSARFGPILTKLGALGPKGWAAIAIITLIVASIMVWVTAFIALKKAISIYIADMEKFRTANFRANGSIQEMTASAYDASIATGIASRETMESVKHISEAGFAFDSLGDSIKTTSGEIITGQAALRELAVMNATFVKTTGASSQATATFQKRLQQSNLTLEQQQRAFDVLTVRAQKYGLTGSDLNDITGQMNKSLMQMNAIYSDAEIEDYIDAMSGLAAAAKRAGVSMAEIAKIDDDLRTLSGSSTMLMALGGHMDDVMSKGPGALANGIGPMVDGYEQLRGQLAGLPKGVQDAALAQAGLSASQVAMLDKEIQNREELAAMSESERVAHLAAKAAETDAATARETSAAAFQTSMGTLKQQLEALLAPLMSLATKLIQPLVAAFTDMTGEASMFTDAVKPAMEAIMAMGEFIWAFMEPFMPIMRSLGKIIFGIVGAIAKVLKVIFKLGAYIVKFALLPFKYLYTAVEVVVDFIMMAFDGLVDSILYPFEKLIEVLEWVMTPIDAMIEGFRGISDGAGEVIDTIMHMANPINAVLDAFTTVKDFLFGSSFLHISEGIDEILPSFSSLFGVVDTLLSPFKMLGEAVNWLFGGGGGGDSADAKAKEGAEKSKQAKSTPKEVSKLQVEKMLVSKEEGDADKTKKAASEKKMLDQMSLMTEGVFAFPDVFDDLATTTMGDNVGKFISGAVGTAVDVITSPLKAIGNLLGITSDEKKAQKATSKESTKTDSAPIYTVKFADGAATDPNVHFSNLITLQSETVTLLAKILEKEDPNSERAAAALEKVAEITRSSGDEVSPFRSRTGFGESAVHWQNSK